jgi:ferric-dicitrate binding protein FerR (iron transport regulator)
MSYKTTTKLCFLPVLLGLCCQAANKVIGVATAAGTFDVDRVSVDGNANLNEGNEVRTRKSASEVLLQNGPTITLAVDSTGQVFENRMSLLHGAAKVEHMDGYSLEAGKVRVVPSETGTRAIVRVEGDEVQVAALDGSVNVLGERGALLTRVGAGSASAFNRDGQTPAPAADPDAQHRRKRKDAALYVFLVASMAGLGLAIDAILQPGSSSPTSGGTFQ